VPGPAMARRQAAPMPEAAPVTKITRSFIIGACHRPGAASSSRPPGDWPPAQAVAGYPLIWKTPP
jgi:hypothetical protein